MKFFLIINVAAAGLISCTKTAQEEVVDSPEEIFIDDCLEALNDEASTAGELIVEEGKRYDAIDLCFKEVDTYFFEIPPYSYVAIELQMDGSGDYKDDRTDLDLYELENPDLPTPAHLDMIYDDNDAVWASATSAQLERLAWYNPSAEPAIKYVQVDGHKKSETTYSLEFTLSEFHETHDCDEFFDDTSEAGPCNRIMQFPQSNTMGDGYVVSHEARYSNLRREVIYLVRYAAAATEAQFENTNPIGLLDMSQADGDTPGRVEDQLRHPEGTHVYGNDIDIAYYQTGDDNLGRSVCQNDGYYCTAEPNILDARRTAFFISRLLDSKRVRVIGVDTMIRTMILDAADDLESEGILNSGARFNIDRFLGYGSGWPFHQHHLHLSWDWEDGHQGTNYKL
jgi:hypothetical protein